MCENPTPQNALPTVEAAARAADYSPQRGPGGYYERKDAQAKALAAVDRELKHKLDTHGWRSNVGSTYNGLLIAKQVVERHLELARYVGD